MPAKFPQELKERAVQLVPGAVDNGELITAASKRIGTELGISPNSLRTWARKHRETAGVSPQEATELAAENRRLRAELAESRRANEILRKASTFYQGGNRPQAALIAEIHRHPPPPLLSLVM